MGLCCDAFSYPHPASHFFPQPNLPPAYDAQFSKSSPATQMMCHHMVMHPPMQSECDSRCVCRHTDIPRDVCPHSDPRFLYFQRLQHMHHHQQQQPHSHPHQSAPREFGSSFDFDTDFESSFRGVDGSDSSRQASHGAFPSFSRQDQDPFAPSSGDRCLSPNNPFSPTFGPSGGRTCGASDEERREAGGAPPRPPTRIPDARRGSCESEAAPPPLPKRKQQPPPPHHQHHYHNAPQDVRYACVSGDRSDSPPPLPLPSRKRPASQKPLFERKVSFETPSRMEDPSDPFNVAYIDRHLSQVSLNQHVSSDRVVSSLESHKKVDTSTPLTSESSTEMTKRSLNLSSIKTDLPDKLSLSASGLNDSSVFESSSVSSGFDSGGYERLQDDGSRVGGRKVHESQTKPAAQEGGGVEGKEGGRKAGGPFMHFGEDHVSPEERNIFRAKDPFAGDDFFAP